MEIVSSEKKDFLAKLSALPSDVGTRLMRRSTENKENFALKYYFTILANENVVQYPIRLVKNESPDYLGAQDEVCFGIEITESTFSAYQYFLTEYERRPRVQFEPSVFVYGEEYTTENIFRFFRPRGSELVAPGWMGEQAEEYASGWALDSLVKKLETVRRWPFASQENLRVLLYQNCPAWVHDVEALGRHLRNRFRVAISAGTLNLDGLKVDYLTSDGKMLVYDIMGVGQCWDYKTMYEAEDAE